MALRNPAAESEYELFTAGQSGQQGREIQSTVRHYQNEHAPIRRDVQWLMTEGVH